MKTKTESSVHDAAAQGQMQGVAAVAVGSAPLTFEQGYVCAVATLLRQHDQPPMARDLLACMGNIDWRKIDPYDRDEIKRHGLLPNGRDEGRPASAKSSTPKIT